MLNKQCLILQGKRTMLCYLWHANLELWKAQNTPVLKQNQFCSKKTTKNIHYRINQYFMTEATYWCNHHCRILLLHVYTHCTCMIHLVRKKQQFLPHKSCLCIDLHKIYYRFNMKWIWIFFSFFFSWVAHMNESSTSCI